MKSKNGFFVTAVIAVVILSGCMIWLFHSCPEFRDFFSGMTSVAPHTKASQEAVAAAQAKSAYLSFGLFLFTLILQLLSFLGAIFIYQGIKQSKEADKLRLIRLENADVFLDLPLYFGLFGTVLSFTIMSFNPAVSKLIAYSSTLIGIIISTILRIICQYPLRQKLVSAIAASKGV